jgi:hypothetical protein
VALGERELSTFAAGLSNPTRALVRVWYTCSVLAGASYNEIALVALLLALVVVAPKVGRIGEALGGLFDKKREGPEDAGG